MSERKRNLRGAWISTVINLDWPSKESSAITDETARVHAQKNELIRILNEAVSMRMNAVFFQVKPCSDAFYQSTLLPWSTYLTGTLGKDPGYDPLQFAIDEAHRRNLELHAWFNPYRISMNTTQSTIDALNNVPAGSPASVYKDHPDWVKTAANRFVLDPGMPEARAWVIQGVMEVAEKYDIDGVHFDDYFYYETDASTLDDDATFSLHGGGFSNKGDWRRNNTLLLITELSTKLRSTQPQIKFGISPAGVWRNKTNDPAGSDTSAGSPNYDNQYADTRLWVLNELIDYIAPQVYWPFTRQAARFGVITQWWADTVRGKNVHLYIGEALYKVGVPSTTEPEWMVDNGVKEIKDQLLSNIKIAEIQGSILFRHLFLREAAVLPAKAAIQQEVWSSVALIPSMPWKGCIPPSAPVNLTQVVTTGGIELRWEHADDASVYYAIYRFIDGNTVDINRTDCLLATVRKVSGQQQSWIDKSTTQDTGVLYAVTALDRNHNESKPCRKLMEKSKKINIDYNSYRSVKSFNSRVRFLVMHYTALNFSGSVNALTGPLVSAHYLVPDLTDPTYISAGFKEQRIFNLVDEKERAWHAGVSAWGNRTNLNDNSIGIEIVNQAKDVSGVFTFPPFNDEQIEAVKQLALNILQRHPDISPTHVIGHSDIALGRKSDPGAAFPWFTLYQAGIGAWYDEETKCKYIAQYTQNPLSNDEAIKLFKKYGYNTSEAATPVGLQKLVRAFQLHFRQDKYDGLLDVETSAILAALAKKYMG